MIRRLLSSLRLSESERGASAVGYGVIIAFFVALTGPVAGAVGGSATDELDHRGDRIGNPDQYVTPVVLTPDGGGYGGDDEIPPPPTTTVVAVDGMSGETSIGGGNNWTASVTVTVTTTLGDIPVGGATVDGTWSEGSVPTSCSTDSSGSCVVTQSGLQMVGTGTVLETTFTVDLVSGTDLLYDPVENAPNPAQLTLYKP